MPGDFRIIVLISGRGSNLKSLIEAAQHARIVRVISNKKDAAGLQTAAAAGIPVTVLPREQFDSLEAQKSAVLHAAQSEHPDLVVLAGFMQIIPPAFIAAFPRRIINIHPALLPRYPGLDTHARVIAAGEREHGCSVHVVDNGVDTGDVIAWARVPVEQVDTPETLATRVLEREHAIYPWAVEAIARGDIDPTLAPIMFSERIRADAAAKNFDIPAA